MMFRPLPGLTAAAVPALALLIALGVWQVQRAQWKADLIAGYEAAEAAPPLPLSQALCEGAQGRVDLDLVLEPLELRIYGAGPAGEPGWLIVQPAFGPQCAPGDHELDRRVLVQSGFETLDGVRSASPRILHLDAWPGIGPFTPEDSPETGEFYRFEAPALAAALGLAADQLPPVWAHWDDRTPLERARIAPADHAGYALTWFGLAAALAGVYLAMHARAGRLRFRPHG